MIVLQVILTVLLSSTLRTPLLNIYTDAADLIAEGNYEESTALFEEIYTRMPDNPRALYNNAVSNLVKGNVQLADSIFSVFPEDVFSEDTLLAARSSSRLGNAMMNEDYAGVYSVVEMLLPEISSGTASTGILQNYEVALKWLMQNEPPPPEDSEEPDDNEDNEDQEESENNEDQEEPEDNEEEEEPRNNEDQEEPEDNEEEQAPPPSNPEMTPDVAQMILDMVEEAEADETEGSVGGAIGVPTW